MATRHSFLTFRLAHSALRLALRLWPEESRQWGLALAAELDDIQQPLEALQWVIGGLMIFIRASALHFLAWLKLPAGSRAAMAPFATETTAPLLPRHSRLLTAGVLLGTALLFFLLQSREAVGTVRSSWRGFSASSGDLRTLETLGARAEKQKDARTLAFVSLVLPDSARATTFAEHAVALDPTLAWIYSSRVGRPDFAPPRQEELARLLDFDPDNAFPELVAARVISDARWQELVSGHALSDQKIESTLASDSAWMGHMDRAFRAPRYDSYFNRNWELTREVWDHDRSLSPSVAFCSLWSHSNSLPDGLSIKTYANVLVHHAQEASLAGRHQQAENLLQQLDSFGRRLTEQSETYFETIVGLSLSRQSARELRNVYLRAGKASESELAAQRLQRIDSRIGAMINSRAIESPQFRVLQRRAIFVQSCAAIAILSILATALSLLALELRREKRGTRRIRKAICFAADWVPVTLLSACIALLWAFQPFASILRSARSAGSASAAWHTMHFEGLFLLSSALGPLYDPSSSYHLWQIFTCILVALFVFVVFGGFLRHKFA
jgi:hypothetical protein